MKKIFVTLLLAVVVLFCTLWFWNSKQEPIWKQQATSFEECAKAGGAVMESYPRQCVVGGESFTEVLSQRPGSMSFEPVVVISPLPNGVIASPVNISGKALGNWFFEASFPVEITDESGAMLGQGIAQAQGEWMTKTYVPFAVEIKFNSAGNKNGYIVFKKDNPSGLPEHDASIRVPVKF